MGTELKKFKEAYATMTVAAYEPLILKWISGWSVFLLADVMAWRLQKARYIKLDKAFATAQALNIGSISKRFSFQTKEKDKGDKIENPKPIDFAGNLFAADKVTRINIDGFPDAVVIGNNFYPYGVMNVQKSASTKIPWQDNIENNDKSFSEKSYILKGNSNFGVRSLPSFLSGRIGTVDRDFDFAKLRKKLFSSMISAVEASLPNIKDSLAINLQASIKNINGLEIYEFWPPFFIEEGLSPIGVAHFYRQLYFNIEEGVGPIEEAFTIAPLETLEVVYEITRKQVHEEIVEMGSETISESAIETKNLDEISDKVSSMIQRDASASMSANASGSIGVWQAGASASASMSVSTQRNREETSRRLKEITTRASERITKSFTIKSRDLEEITSTNLTRRLIKNENNYPVSYGLRRVLRKVKVKVQDLGPYLVWQLYVRNPGEGLARSRFVHFREAEPISVPEVPPGLPPRPAGGIDTGSTSSDIAWDSSLAVCYVTIVITTGTDRVINAVSIDSITDLEGGGKDDPAPSPLNDIQWGAGWDTNVNTYTKHIAVLPGDSASVSITYTYSWEPSQQVLDEWETKRQQEIAKLTQEALNAQFEREKSLITERSKIKPRPANDLRREERYEVLNRMISHLFARGDDPSEPTPLEIEYFHRYFDIEGMFVYNHPSWWKPRYSPVTTSFGRPAYEITAESEPAAMGSSLGWMIQLDGDTRRNEFINSPWLRVCLPIRSSREREAIQWLAKHIEGEYGYDLNKAPLKDLIKDIETIRQDQNSLGVDGPNYVTIDSTVGAPQGPVKPQNVYPIINEFDVTLPTDGFVYDELKLVNG